MLPKYNGWTNYPTWNVALWIQNDEFSYRFWIARARELYEEADGCESKKLKQAVARLAAEIQAQVENDAPKLVGAYEDLLGWALSYVDWQAVAESLLD